MLCRFGNLGPVERMRRKPLFEGGNGISEIVAARGQRLSEDRVSNSGPIVDSGALLFNGNVAIEQLRVTLEIGDHLPDPRGFPLCDVAGIKTTLVSHYMLQNDPFSQGSVRAQAV